MSLSPAELVEWARLKSYIDEDGCWQYVGGTNARGYPVAYLDGACFPLRRRVFAGAVRSLGRGEYVSMSCGQWRCVNPEHMRAGSRSQYMRRACGGARSADIVVRVTAAQRARPDCRLNMEAARTIRRRVEAGELQRMVAAELGVSRSLVSMVVRNRIWREPSPWAI
jgi:hypothetical protein